MMDRDNRRLTEKQAARYLGGSDLPASTLRYWRHVGQGPLFYKIGRHVRYDIQDLDLFLARCRRRSTTGPIDSALDRECCSQAAIDDTKRDLGGPRQRTRRKALAGRDSRRVGRAAHHVD